MGSFSEIEVDWTPFFICKNGERAPYPRGLTTVEGLADRLRFVAFAEKQATTAFLNAPEVFHEVSPTVKEVWRTLAREEGKHLQWLLWRMEELKMSISERPVSIALWQSFHRCTTPQQFAEFMFKAEERGRIAGEQFYETLLNIDPTTAKIFRQIALEEQEHIRLAQMILDHQFNPPPNFEIKLNTIPLSDYSKLITD